MVGLSGEQVDGCWADSAESSESSCAIPGNLLTSSDLNHFYCTKPWKSLPHTFLGDVRGKPVKSSYVHTCHCRRGGTAGGEGGGGEGGRWARLSVRASSVLCAVHSDISSRHS